MRVRWPDCDVCGIADEETKDFKDGNGDVCCECRDVILAAGGQPDPEPDPEQDAEPEQDADHGPEAKRRRM